MQETTAWSQLRTGQQRPSQARMQSARNAADQQSCADVRASDARGPGEPRDALSKPEPLQRSGASLPWPATIYKPGICREKRLHACTPVVRSRGCTYSVRVGVLCRKTRMRKRTKLFRARPLAADCRGQALCIRVGFWFCFLRRRQMRVENTNELARRLVGYTRPRRDENGWASSECLVRKVSR